MPVIPSQSHQPATSNEQIFAEASERLRIAEQSEGANRQAAVIDLEFEDGQQWPTDIYNQRKVSRRPTLTINHTRAMVKRVVNNMRMQRPRIKVHPVSDGADVDLANKIGGLIRHIEQRSEGATAYDIGGESAVKMGWGYWRILSEYIAEDSFEQELKIAPIRNPFTVYMDPAAILPAGEDAEWCIITEVMKRSEFERKYPDENETEWRDGGQGDMSLDWQTKEEIRLAEYFRIVKKKDWLVKLTDGRSIFESEMKEGYQVALNLRGDPIRRPSYRRQLEWHRLNGSTVVESVNLPGKWIPVVRCEGNVMDINGQIKRKGMVRDLIDTQRAYDYWRTCETEVIALAPRAPWVGTTNQFDGHSEWNDANQVPYSKLTYTPDFIEQPDGSKTPLPPPQRVEPVAIPAGFVAAAESALKDLMILAGMPHEPGQDAPGQVVSGKALRARQALSDIGHFQYYDNQTKSICHTGRIILDLIPYYYSEARMQRIIGEDGVPEVVGINQPQDPNEGGAGAELPLPGQPPIDPAVAKIKNDLTVGRYDVVMDTGPGFETRRMEAVDSMLDLMRTPLGEPVVKVGADLVVRNMDWPGASDLADRLAPLTPQGLDKAIKSLPKQAQGIVTAMQQQLQQATQHIQQLEQEIKLKTNIENNWIALEKYKVDQQTSVKANDAALKSHTELTKNAVDSHTRIAVAEIGEAGQMLNTNVEAAHEKVARQDMLKAAEKAEKKGE
jgi:hypothetical protein